MQEAKANDIVVDRAEIDQSYARVAQNFGQNPQQFDTYLRDQGSSAASMKRQIEGELAWGRLLRRNVQPFVNVGEEEVQSIIDRRSEEHTSELQSLMRISYAVFCLK